LAGNGEGGYGREWNGDWEGMDPEKNIVDDSKNIYFENISYTRWIKIDNASLAT